MNDEDELKFLVEQVDALQDTDNPEDFVITEESQEVLDTVIAKEPIVIDGLEALGVREGLKLYFAEIFRGVDRAMASLAVKVYKVDYNPLVVANRKGKLNFLKDKGTVMTMPKNYDNHMGGMMAYTTAIVRAPYMVSTMHTEARRFYKWLKDIIKSGKIGVDFKYAVTDFSELVETSEAFIRSSVKNSNITPTRTLGDVYVNYEELFAVFHKYNVEVSTIKARDTEMLTKETTAIYNLCQLMLTKIEHNELVLDSNGLKDLELTINTFVKYINVTGAMVILLNELGAVISEQVKTVRKINKV